MKPWRKLSKPRPVGAKLSPAAARLAVLETVEKDHGRIETRRYYQSAEVDWFADRAKWEGLQSMGMVEALREMGGQRTVERRYYLTSLPLGVETFARHQGQATQRQLKSRLPAAIARRPSLDASALSENTPCNKCLAV